MLRSSGHSRPRAPRSSWPISPTHILRALETVPIEEIAPPPLTVLPLDEVFAAVICFVEDDALSGALLVLVGGEEPRFL